jgi:hypothetical protein
VSVSSFTALAGLPGDTKNISTGGLRLGFDVKSGAAVSFLTCTTSNCSQRMKAGTNYISTWDAGRFMQQSYYGNADGSSWAKQSWVYNTVQGGSWHTGDLSLTMAKRLSFRSAVRACSACCHMLYCGAA